jgi:hypothetical protein
VGFGGSRSGGAHLPIWPRFPELLDRHETDSVFQADICSDLGSAAWALASAV